MLDARTERNLINVHPQLVHLCYMMDATGHKFIVPDPPRTQAQQDELYAQGRTKPGKIVTWTKSSKHIIQPDGFAHAFDFVPKPVNYENIKPFIDMGHDFEVEAEALGISIIWGGRWKTPDYPHIELVG